MKNSHNYKQTEIGKIPKEWDVVRLGDEQVAEIRGNKSINGFNKVAFIPMEAVPDSGIFVNFEIRPMEEVKSFTYCESGDLLLAKITPSLENGKQGIVPDSVPNGFALATTEVFPIKCKSIEKLFLFYVLKDSRFRNKIIASMTGTTGRQRATKVSVKNLFIPLPPFPEQQKIAEILSTVDQAIEKVDDSIAKTERLKKGLMQELLTKGIGHKEFKDTEIGRIPKEWEVVRLGEVVDINKESRDPNREFPEREFLYIDIDSIENGTGVIKAAKTLIGKKAPSRARRVIHYNDVIMSTVRPYLKAFAIVPREYDAQICSTGFAVLTCKERILPSYLLYTLFSNYVISQCNRMMVGGQYPALNNSQVEKIKLPLPSISEQQKIAEILSTVDKRLELLREKKERLGRVKKGLMNDLLTGKRRVKV